jgi:hypothetical protein
LLLYTVLYRKSGNYANLKIKCWKKTFLSLRATLNIEEGGFGIQMANARSTSLISPAVVAGKVVVRQFSYISSKVKNYSITGVKLI